MNAERPSKRTQKPAAHATTKTLGKPSASKRSVAMTAEKIVATTKKQAKKVIKGAKTPAPATRSPSTSAARPPVSYRARRTHWQTLTKRAIAPVGTLPVAAPTVFTTAAAGAPKRVLSFSAGLEPVVASDEALSGRLERLVREVTFTVALRTRSGQPIQEQRGLIGTLTSVDLDGLRPDDRAADLAITRLESLGFAVLRRGRFGITARGPAELVADALGTALQVMAQPSTRRPRSLAGTVISDVGISPQPSRLYLAPPQSLNLRSRISENIDHFVFTPPPLYFGAPSAVPPAVGWQPINETAIRSLLRVPAAGPTGRGVKVGIVDTGFHDHPYYAGRNIQRVPVVTSTNPTEDDDGHGTAILYNLVAMAPDADIYAFAQSNPPQDSLEEAFAAGVHVLTCSWGFDNEMSFPILEATIRDGVEQGCIVLFAAGNGHHAWPGSMPDVLSIGGVYADPASHALQASNYASGFMSSLYPNRRVPDFCGLCGQIPNGIYFLMPTAPGSRMDQNLAGHPFDDFDETKANDGWCGASGTSSTTPQIAGAIALLLEAAHQKGNTLSPATVRQVLSQSAQPVTTGRNAFGFPASAGVPNAATGFGLVDVDAALKQLKGLGLA